MNRAKLNGHDSILDAIRKSLDGYKRTHPKAQIEVKRQNPVSVRIRIVDPAFKGMDLVEREEKIWRILSKLKPRVRSDITFLLLITPGEKAESSASFDFDHPIPSLL